MLLPLALMACKTNQPETGLARPPEIPELPANLARKAEALPPIPDSTMGTAHIQGTKDDIQYNAVAFQLNNVIDLYNCVRISLNERTDLKKCL